MKTNWLNKGLVFSITLLFIGVTVAPSINQSVVKSSNDHDLVEVSIQACGIQGKGDSTVKITREQADNLDTVFEMLNRQLKNATSREESVRILQAGVIELDRLGLLPEGMTVQQTQKLILGPYDDMKMKSTVEKLISQNIAQMQAQRFFCFVTGIVQEGDAIGILLIIGALLMFFSIFPSPFYFLFGNNLALLLGDFFFIIGSIITIFSPLAIMQLLNIQSGNLTIFGLGGSTHLNKGRLNGFTGIKITRFATSKMYLLGFSLAVWNPEKLME